MRRGARRVGAETEADNLFCLFGTVEGAVRAGKEIGERLDAANVVLPEDRRLYAAIGIGYGRVLNVEDEDIYGDEVNLASKLGEDVAKMGEILLTTAAHERAEGAGVRSREEVVSVSGRISPRAARRVRATLVAYEPTPRATTTSRDVG